MLTTSGATARVRELGDGRDVLDAAEEIRVLDDDAGQIVVEVRSDVVWRRS